MATGDLINVIAQSGGLLGLAIFAIWMLNKVWESRLAEEKANTEAVKQMWECTRKALEENTAAVTKLLERMRE